MAEFQTIAAICGLVKTTWQTLELIKETKNAQQDARDLWDRVSAIYGIVVDIDDDIRSGKIEALDDRGIQTIERLERVLESCYKSLEELARRCQPLRQGDKLGFSSRTLQGIHFALSAKSIERFERSLLADLLCLKVAYDRFEKLMDNNASRQRNLEGDHRPSHIPPNAVEPTPVNHPQRDTIETLPRSIPGNRRGLGRRQSDPAGREVQQRTANWPNTSGQARLIGAMRDCSPGRFQELLESGAADVNERDNEDYTPLMHAAKCGHGDACEVCCEYLNKLIECNADLNLQRKGQTALHISVKNDNLQAAEILLKKGAEVDASYPDTPLLLAVKRDQVAFVELFLTAGANVGVVDGDWGWSLLHHAVDKNSKRSLLALLRHREQGDIELDLKALKARLEAGCNMGFTPLMHLAEKAHRPENVGLAKALLDHGADVNATDEGGRSALYHAVQGGPQEREKFVKFLVEKGAKVEPVRRKARKRVDLFPVLRQSGEGSHRRDSAVSSASSTTSRRMSEASRRSRARAEVSTGKCGI